MALINCPECGKKDVSDKAAKCPECGYPLIQQNKNKIKKTIIILVIIGTVVLLGVGGLILYLLINNSKDSNQGQVNVDGRSNYSTSSSSNEKNQTNSKVSSVENDPDFVKGRLPKNVIKSLAYDSFDSQSGSAHFGQLYGALYSNTKMDEKIVHWIGAQMHNEEVYGYKIVSEGVSNNGVLIYVYEGNEKYTYYFTREGTDNILYFTSGWITDISEFNPQNVFVQRSY